MRPLHHYHDLTQMSFIAHSHQTESDTLLLKQLKRAHQTEDSIENSGDSQNSDQLLESHRNDSNLVQLGKIHNDSCH